MWVGGHNWRWQAVTCTKAKPPPWGDWEDHNPNQADLGWLVFFIIIEYVCMVSLTYYLAFMNRHQQVISFTTPLAQHREAAYAGNGKEHEKEGSTDFPWVQIPPDERQQRDPSWSSSPPRGS